MKREFFAALLPAVVLLAVFSWACAGGGGKTNPPPPPPPSTTIAFTSPTNGSTVSGASVQVCVQVQNPSAGAQVQFKVAGANLGQPVAVGNDGRACITWDTTKHGNGSVTLRAELVGATIAAQISVTVNNQSSQTPEITGISHTELFNFNPEKCSGPCEVIGGVTVTGKNFTDVTMQVSGGVRVSFQINSSTQLTLAFNFTGSGFNPGATAIKVCNSHGCSGEVSVYYTGLFQTAKLRQDKLYHLHQGEGKVVVFARDTLAKIGEFSVGSPTFAFAVDNKTGSVVTTAGGTKVLGVYRKGSESSPLGVGNGKQVLDVDVLDGMACVSQPQDGLLSCKDISNITSSAFDFELQVGGRPHPVTMWKEGDTLFCATVDIEGNRLIIVDLTAKTFFAVSINGLRKASEIPLPFGGWQLAYLGQRLAYLHQADRKLVFFEPDFGAETQRVDLASIGAIPARIAPDEAKGVLVVLAGEAGVGRNTARLFDVNPGTGQLTELSATTSPMMTGHAPDGSRFLLTAQGKATAVNRD